MKKSLQIYIFSLVTSTGVFAQNFSKSVINSNTGARPYTIASGYLDADSYLDIAIGTDVGGTVEWYKNNGDGTFASAILLTATAPNNLTNVNGIAIADINNDGQDDIIATGFGNDKVVWFENNGDDTFEPAITIADGIDGAGTVILANLDNDPNGYLDLVVSSYGPDGDSDSVVYMLGNGDSTFGSIEYLVPETAGAGPGSFDLADFDGDGDLDAVVGFTDNGNVLVYDNRLIPDGTLSFLPYTNAVNTGNNYLTSVSFGDVNDDGILDVIKSDYSASGGSAGIVWYSIDAAGIGTTFTAHPVPTSIGNTSIGSVADFNNDTYNDLLVTNGAVTDNDIVWFMSDGSGGLGSEIVIDDTHQSIFDIEIQDFDNDGDLDFVTVSYFNNDLYLFLNDLIVLGTPTNVLTNVIFYPNPASDRLYIKGLNSENPLVSVYDILGNRVISSSLNFEESLDVSQLSSGTYILRFENSDSNFKFIKQ